ncbi:MAG: MotA/TolQ/ExbB proton channel family protein, partial [Verrucomicrobiota bacterium]|nr:MotA/TolQ/ExbB proton channel family protein [Verrucomicrobiota bacterium]
TSTPSISKITPRIVPMAGKIPAPVARVNPRHDCGCRRPAPLLPCPPTNEAGLDAMGHELTLLEMMKTGWVELSILFVLSIFSVTIILERLHTLRKVRLDAGQFISNVLKMIEPREIAEAVAYCDRFRQPLARVVRAILLTAGERADKERVMLHTLRVELRQLEAYVPVLATVAGIAPFIGLFGTVVGIIRVFRDMYARSGGGMDVVAGGVAEALITTAAGLIVAVPAVVGYNYCMIRIKRLAEDIELYAYHVIETDLER